MIHPHDLYALVYWLLGAFTGSYLTLRAHNLLKVRTFEIKEFKHNSVRRPVK